MSEPLLSPLALAGLPEAELLTRARSGEHAAFAAIMQRCNQRLFRVARSILADEAEAEDVLQQAYLNAFAAIARFRGESGLATWLTRIVINEARGRLRARRPAAGLGEVEAAQASGEILPFPGRVSADPEGDAARAQVRRMIEHAVDDLPEAFRLVFILREVEELSVEETAAQLELKPETVRTRLHRARRLLRAALESRLAEGLRGAYPFLGERCARITAAVLAELRARGA